MASRRLTIIAVLGDMPTAGIHVEFRVNKGSTINVPLDLHLRLCSGRRLDARLKGDDTVSSRRGGADACTRSSWDRLFHRSGLVPPRIANASNDHRPASRPLAPHHRTQRQPQLPSLAQRPHANRTTRTPPTARNASHRLSQAHTRTPAPYLPEMIAALHHQAPSLRASPHPVAHSESRPKGLARVDQAHSPLKRAAAPAYETH
ncbi:hypothetical protein B0H16DRAFT_1828954 [Mycena metata]|uniref:Uncharacterized protein n=1 Tax=Mycena metata TaxID=1033252 RepID=A0AAD7J6J8_9AGAR|nr:hypothetical protein B0H16DRAFT_1828954 [Mycena metata]